MLFLKIIVVSSVIDDPEVIALGRTEMEVLDWMM